MRVKKIFTLFILSVMVFLSGCGGSAHQAAIIGLVAHTHRMMIPAGMVITVWLEDTTKSGAAGRKISEEVIKSPGEELPIPFAIVYDPNKINEKHSYSIIATIDDSSGKMLYTNKADIPVITKGNPTQDIYVIVLLVGG